MPLSPNKQEILLRFFDKNIAKFMDNLFIFINKDDELKKNTNVFDVTINQISSLILANVSFFIEELKIELSVKETTDLILLHIKNALEQNLEVLNNENKI